MGTLPVDQSFRYDGPLGSFGREAGFLFHSSIDASCIPGVEDSQSLRWRLVAGAICVCSFHASHVGIAIDVRVAFWRNLAATVQHVSKVHSHCPLLLAGDSNIWFPTFELGRVRQTDLALIPIVQEMMDSHGLILRNQRDGDPTSHDSYRPISLASCAFKVFEHMIYARIALHIFAQFDECQGGFRWGADVMTYSPLDTLRLRQHTHTFVAFVDIKKAFDSSLVEATMVRLYDVGISGRMWHLIANFLSLRDSIPSSHW